MATVATENATAVAAHPTVRVRPERGLLRSGVLSFALATTPVFAVLYLLGSPIGTWSTILIVHALVSVLAGVCLVRYLIAFAAVEGDHLIYRAFSTPVVRIPLTRVDRAVLAETYRWNAPDSVPQLLLLDSAGRCVDRMRGIFWSDGDIRAIAKAVGRPVEFFPEPVTMQEFFASYPTGRYWFENRTVAAAATVLSFGGAMAAVPFLMVLAGIPVFDS